MSYVFRYRGGLSLYDCVPLSRLSVIISTFHMRLKVFSWDAKFVDLGTIILVICCSVVDRRFSKEWLTDGPSIIHIFILLILQNFT